LIGSVTISQFVEGRHDLYFCRLPALLGSQRRSGKLLHGVRQGTSTLPTTNCCELLGKHTPDSRSIFFQLHKPKFAFCHFLLPTLSNIAPPSVAANFNVPFKKYLEYCIQEVPPVMMLISWSTAACPLHPTNTLELPAFNS
jgi:hypothetical protein